MSADTPTVEDVSKLHLGERDILVVRCEQDMTHTQARIMLERLRQTVTEATGNDRFPILLCLGTVTLDCINDQVIRELGWIKPTICGVSSASGPNGEPLACGYQPGHDGAHSWASLPTFVPGTPYPPEVHELIQGAIEATDDTPRTARLRAALEPFGVR